MQPLRFNDDLGILDDSLSQASFKMNDDLGVLSDTQASRFNDDLGILPEASAPDSRGDGFTPPETPTPPTFEEDWYGAHKLDPEPAAAELPSPDPTESLKRGAEHLGKSALQVAAGPARIATDLSKAIPYVAILAKKLGPDWEKAIGDWPIKSLRDLNALKKQLTFVDEGYTDTAMSMVLGGGAGAGMRKLMERAKPMAALARQAGLTESLTTTAIKSGLSAAIGDKLVIDQALNILEPALAKSDLSPGTKDLIRATAPILIGVISGTTIEHKIDRMLKNPLAIGFFDEMARKKASPEEVIARFKQAPSKEPAEPGVSRPIPEEVEEDIFTRVEREYFTQPVKEKPAAPLNDDLGILKQPVKPAREPGLVDMALNDMVAEVKAGEPGRFFRENIGEGWETRGVASGYPHWYRKLSKDLKIGKNQFLMAIDKGRKGLKLGKQQERIWFAGRQVARDLSERGEYGHGKLLDEAEKALKQIQIRGHELEKGDKIWIEKERFDVKGFDKQGNAILEDGSTFKLDPDEPIMVDRFVPTEAARPPAKPKPKPQKPKKGIPLGDHVKLHLHPSTITGPIGGLAAGVDWEEYKKTGKIKIDANKMIQGALVGAATGAGIRPARNLAHQIAHRWDKFAKEKIIDNLKDVTNGLIVGEDLRRGLGLGRSQKFKDMMREHKRDVAKFLTEAGRIGKEIQDIAPSKLEQKRMMQVIRGSITASPDLAVKAKKVNKLFTELRDKLKEYKLLEYSRFDKLTRKERARLRKICSIPDPDSITDMNEIRRIAKEIGVDQTQFKFHGSNLFQGVSSDQGVPSLTAFARDIGIKLPYKTKLSSRQLVNLINEQLENKIRWAIRDKVQNARDTLYDHYHFASAQEYAPLYYERFEGFTPKQRQVIEDEIKRLKIKSRRGNPEGRQDLEAMIAEMEGLLGRGRQARAQLARSRQQLNKAYSHRRLEMPVEVQKMLGVIEEAPYPVAKMIGVQFTDIGKARLFQRIVDNPEWCITPSKAIPEAPANYYKIADDRFGALDGKFVRKDIWEDLKEVEEWRGSFVRNWDKYLGWWKYGKVVVNPATQFRNAYSNTILAYLGDVNPTDVKTYSKAFKAIRNTEADKFYKEAQDWGLFNNTFYSAEINKLRDELTDLRDPSALKNWIRKAFSAPADLYESNEKFFKMAVFIKAREGGATVDAAARKAEKFIFNYGDIPPWVKHMKRWVSPFFTFTYKAVPLAAEMAIRKPWKIAAIAGAMYGMEELARHSLGMSKEEAEAERAMLSEWQQRRLVGIGPYVHVLMPFRDKWGNNLYFDLAYILPYGNIAEKWGQSAIPFSDLLPSNPLFQISAAILTNKQPFTGQPIYNEILDGAAQIAGKYAQYAWREIAPSMAPGGYGFNKLKTGFMNTFMGKDVRDWADRPIEFQTAVLSSLLGIKLSPANQQKLKQFEMGTRRKIASSVSKEISRLKTDYRRNKIDKEEYQRKSRELVDLKKRLLAERPKP